MFTKYLAVAVVSGAGFAGVALAADVGASLATSAPVFPVAKAAKVDAPSVVPTGAQYRVRSGRSVKYVACDRQRTFGASNVELGCLTFSATKGWSKSVRWFPKYQLAPLAGELPSEPVVTALR